MGMEHEGYIADCGDLAGPWQFACSWSIHWEEGVRSYQFEIVQGMPVPVDDG